MLRTIANLESIYYDSETCKGWLLPETLGNPLNLNHIIMAEESHIQIIKIMGDGLGYLEPVLFQFNGGGVPCKT